MKKLILLVACCTVGCADGIVRPTSTQFICKTQPRGYWNPATGVGTLEVDTYTQSTPCPATPIE